MPIAIVLGINFPHGKYWEHIILPGVLLLCDSCTRIFMILQDGIEWPFTNKVEGISENDEWDKHQPSPYYFFKKFNYIGYEVGTGIYFVLLGTQIAWFQ